MANEKNLQATGTQAPVATSKAASDRFMEAVIKNISANSGNLDLNDYQKRLGRGYFRAIDNALKVAEEYRVAKNTRNTNHKYDNALPVTWENVNMPALAENVARHCRLGLDMSMRNQVHAVPYKNNTTNQYDIGFVKGYEGIEMLSKKYALEPPANVIVELVYETDTFQPHKKSKDNNIESYDFKINNPFERGKIIGGFGYIVYPDPTKNKLIIVPLKDILKRKPEYAAVEFWGGTKAEYKNGEKSGEKIIDGWFETMCEKTIKRIVYDSRNIPLDPKKVDDDFVQADIIEHEARLSEAYRDAEDEIGAGANTVLIGNDNSVNDIDPSTGEITRPTSDKSPSEGKPASGESTTVKPDNGQLAFTDAPKCDF
jgi:recombination protein RecT